MASPSIAAIVSPGRSPASAAAEFSTTDKRTGWLSTSKGFTMTPPAISPVATITASSRLTAGPASTVSMRFQTG